MKNDTIEFLKVLYLTHETNGTFYMNEYMKGFQSGQMNMLKNIINEIDKIEGTNIMKVLERGDET